METKDKFKVIIAGGRDFNNYQLLTEKVTSILKNKLQTHRVVIISGHAEGADKLGEFYASKNGIETIIMPAEWKVYGKQAGFRRNYDMLKIADALIAFWDGKSHGTKHMIEIAQNKIPARIIKY